MNRLSRNAQTLHKTHDQSKRRPIQRPPAAKEAIVGLVRSAAAGYARQRIRINAMAPGMMRTRATRQFFPMASAEQLFSAQYPLGRVGHIEDTARAIAWLLCDEACGITGQVLPSDGGSTAVRPILKVACAACNE